MIRPTKNTNCFFYGVFLAILATSTGAFPKSLCASKCPSPVIIKSACLILFSSCDKSLTIEKPDTILAFKHVYAA